MSGILDRGFSFALGLYLPHFLDCDVFGVLKFCGRCGGDGKGAGDRNVDPAWVCLLIETRRMENGDALLVSCSPPYGTFPALSAS